MASSQFVKFQSSDPFANSFPEYYTPVSRYPERHESIARSNKAWNDYQSNYNSTPINVGKSLGTESNWPERVRESQWNEFQPATTAFKMQTRHQVNIARSSDLIAKHLERKLPERKCNATEKSESSKQSNSSELTTKQSTVDWIRAMLQAGIDEYEGDE